MIVSSLFDENFDANYFAPMIERNIILIFSDI